MINAIFLAALFAVCCAGIMGAFRELRRSKDDARKFKEVGQ